MDETADTPSETDAPLLTNEEALANINAMLRPSRKVRRLTESDTGRDLGVINAAQNRADQRLVASKRKRLKRQIGNPIARNVQFNNWVETVDEGRAPTIVRGQG